MKKLYDAPMIFVSSYGQDAICTSDIDVMGDWKWEDGELS